MSKTLPLEIINEAFGPTADLYRDVLGVKANASGEQIQRAYFERRNELFQLLAELEAAPEQDSISATKRFQAERKMDALVMTLRVLGDAEMRSAYDDVRSERIPARTLAADPVEPSGATPKTTFRMEEAGDIPMKPRSVLKKSTYNVVSSDAEESSADVVTCDTSFDEIMNEEVPSSPDRNNVSFGGESSPKDSKNRRNKRKARRVSPDEPRKGTGALKKKPNKDQHQSKQPQRQEDSIISSVGPDAETDVESVVSERSFRTLETTLTTYEKERGFFETLRDECLGALDDTTRSFHQVFSVFTLREDEINAVTGRIDKARRQMIHSLHET